MSHVDLIIDSREKKPLTFPAHLVVLDRGRLPTAGRSRTLTVRTQTQTLKTGDYRLVGGHSAIERKGSFEEIAGNCLTPDGYRRFTDCCKRLRDECRTACLLFEGAIGAFEVRAGLPHPGVATDALLDIIGAFGLPLILMPLSTVGQRRAAGEWALRWLISQERSHVIGPDLHQHEQRSLRNDHGGCGRGTNGCSTDRSSTSEPCDPFNQAGRDCVPELPVHREQSELPPDQDPGQ